jgi:hypothetical protein
MLQRCQLLGMLLPHCISLLGRLQCAIHQGLLQ